MMNQSERGKSMADDIDTWASMFGKDAAKPKTPELVVNHKDKKPYSAFEAQDKLLGFSVYVPSINMMTTFFYHHLCTLTANYPAYDFLCLTTNTSVIKIYGRNLYPLSTALGLHTCKFFAEFHPDYFLDPTDESKPFISRIEVSVIRGGSEIQKGLEAK
jgi:hypothetical protein